MNSAFDLVEVKRFEVSEVHAHPDAKVDIVLIHGLNGHPRKTWTAKNGVFWPTDLLPVTLKSTKARILVYGYNADVYAFGSGKSASSDMIHQHAQSLLSNLALERKSEEAADHPLIVVVHSLGGILLKRALELSYDLTSKNVEDNRSIYVSTYGIIFLGTPQNGADAAKWGSILQGMVHALIPKKILDSELQLVRTLQTNNETLQNINLHFLDIYHRFKICMVHEQEKTDLKGTKIMIVDQDSAGPMLPDVVYFGIEATHSNMCKFESKNSPGYLNVSTFIKTWVQECLPTIQARWDMERKTRRQIREAQAAELLDIYPLAASDEQASENRPDVSNSNNNSIILTKSTTSIEPPPFELGDGSDSLFITPAGFRPNSIFVGRESELAEIHRLLLDSKRRAQGTSAVLIQSMPGGGKTHLARQYIYEFKADWPGGVFWLRAKSRMELAAGFWDIARKVALKPAMVSEGISCLSNSEQFIRLVRKWFNHRDGWLMVLDGIRFDDAEGLRQFIPDRPDTGLIYTSTEKSVSGDYRWMNPQVIRLPLPSAGDAQRLLLLELDIREPFQQEDLKHAMELVQLMGFLPTVIHAMAQRLKATDEPLGKFARRFALEPRLRGIGAYVDVVDQLKVLGAYEALNLIYILCFFSQCIPVEMISLGVKALDVPIRASEPITGRTLNNTFKILNMFALIDRNDHHDCMQSSQNSKGSKDAFAENVDILKLHSIVQGFFVDTLLADGRLPMWLDRAVRLFCYSYDMANERITRKTNAGLVEDYRLYQIHGIRLQNHLRKHHRKAPALVNVANMLRIRLVLIKDEIERRTPESSQLIAKEQSDAFQASIFDRTSSSSDTGPETPSDEKTYSDAYAWGLEHDKASLEPPLSTSYNESGSSPLVNPQRSRFLSLPTPDDPGYYSDQESGGMIAQSAQRIEVQPLSSMNSRSAWQKKKKTTLGRLDRRDHRITRTVNRQGYYHRAEVFGALIESIVEPQFSGEMAKGFIDGPGTQSRGTRSGQSVAEVALTHITKIKPPLPKKQAQIRDKGFSVSSARGLCREILTAKTPSYAAAALCTTLDSIAGYRETKQVVITSQGSSNEYNSSLGVHPPSAARLALQHFSADRARSPPSPQSPIILRPQYAPSPGLIYQGSSLSPDDVFSDIADDISQEHPFNSANSNLRNTRSIPWKGVSLSSPPRKCNCPKGSPALQSQSYSDIIIPRPTQVVARLNHSFSLPDIRTSDRSHFPGPVASSASPHRTRYTSPTISFDDTGQSSLSNQSVLHENSAQRIRRRSVLVLNNTTLHAPTSSSSSPPTDYQVYTDLRNQLEFISEPDLGRRGKISRLASMTASNSASKLGTQYLFECTIHLFLTKSSFGSSLAPNITLPTSIHLAVKKLVTSFISHSAHFPQFIAPITNAAANHSSIEHLGSAAVSSTRAEMYHTWRRGSWRLIRSVRGSWKARRL